MKPERSERKADGLLAPAPLLGRSASHESLSAESGNLELRVGTSGGLGDKLALQQNVDMEIRHARLQPELARHIGAGNIVRTVKEKLQNRVRLYLKLCRSPHRGIILGLQARIFRNNLLMFRQQCHMRVLELGMFGLELLELLVNGRFIAHGIFDGLVNRPNDQAQRPQPPGGEK